MRTLCFFLLLASQALAQLDATVLSGFSGYKNPIVLGDMILGEATENTKAVTVGYVSLTTKAAIVNFSASDVSRKEVPFFIASDTTKEETRYITYIITTSGDVWIDVECVDFDKKIYDKYRKTLSINPPKPPEPPKPPAPTIPDDAFNNIGQRVAEWTKGNPNNTTIGQIYLDASKDIRSNTNLTFNEAGLALVKKLKESSAYINYELFRTNLNADAASRGPMTKGVLSEYWRCVALGLGVK